MLELIALPAYVLMHTVCLGDVTGREYYEDFRDDSKMTCYEVTQQEFDEWYASFPQSHQCVVASPRYLEYENIWIVKVTKDDSWQCQ